MNYLNNEQTLFKNTSVFEEGYEPEAFQYRDAQLRELAISVRPVLQNTAPRHSLLRGLPGTGKTTTG